MNRCISILSFLVALGTALTALPVLACTQETADRLAATDTQARRDADMLAGSDNISYAVLTAIRVAPHGAHQDEVYVFSVEQTLRGARSAAFETPSMVVFSCRFGDQSWNLDRLRVGDRVLVLGDTAADGAFIPEHILPIRDRRARRLLALFQRTATRGDDR